MGYNVEIAEKEREILHKSIAEIELSSLKITTTLVALKMGKIGVDRAAEEVKGLSSECIWNAMVLRKVLDLPLKHQESEEK